MTIFTSLMQFGPLAFLSLNRIHLVIRQRQFYAFMPRKRSCSMLISTIYMTFEVIQHFLFFLVLIRGVSSPLHQILYIFDMIKFQHSTQKKLLSSKSAAKCNAAVVMRSVQIFLILSIGTFLHIFYHCSF